ncbi:MAG: CGGC domain-containing protein [Spirochaetes bacterium RBG_16_49_21]|nr:MAG: CGGC domain-containing protein [Spirochaetes bacterium RBG_16_49_21]
MKIGLIRCLQTEDICQATTDFKVMKNKKGAFEGIEEEIEIVGVVSCGGCPGKKAVSRAAEMVKRGADAIAMASCISRGTPIGFPCPNAEMIIDTIKKKAGDSVRLFEFTH